MKKLTLLILSGFVCLFISAQNVELKYKLKANETYRLKQTRTENSTRTIQGMAQNTESVTSSVFSIKPLTLNDEFFIASVKFDTMVISNSMPPMKIESANEGDLSSPDPVTALTAIIHRLCNTEFIVKLDYTGKVLEIVNYDAASKNILQGVDQIEGQAKMMVEMQANMLTSKEMISGMVESTMNILPGAKVKKGDSWKTDINFSAGGIEMNITTDFNLTSIEGKKASFEGKSVIMPASDEPVNMNGAMITSQLQGMGKVNFVVDSETGFIISGTTKTQVSGNMIVTAQGNTMEIPVESIAESTVTAL